MTSDMRVLVFDGPHQMHIETRPRPEPRAGEALVDVGFVGICGSDIHGYSGESGRRAPGMIMGHEASGWVAELGPEATGPAPGTAVTFIPSLYCGGECGHRVENQCDQLKVIGVAPEIQGAFADAIVVPADRLRSLGGLSPEVGATIEPVAIGVHAVDRAGVQAGQTVLVVGGGMIGQCVAHSARLAGADSITISEPDPHRRSLAEASGFSTVAPGELGDRGLFDVAFDAVGVSPTAAASIEAVRKGSTVCFVGLGHGEIQIPLFSVVVAERHIVGSFAYPDAAFEAAIEHLTAGRIDVGPLIGSVEAFEGVADAFEDLATRARADAKVLMATGAEPPS